MRTITRIGALSLFVCALAFGETWTGRLIDANCNMQQGGQTQQSHESQQQSQQQSWDNCNPTSSTSSFGLLTSDQRMYRFDSDGNRKAADAFRNSQSGAERSSNPETQQGQVTATVKGTLRSGSEHNNRNEGAYGGGGMSSSYEEIKVDSIQVH